MMTSTAKRPVSLGTTLRVLLSGSLNQGAWILLGFGLIGFWVVISSVDLSFFRYWGEVEHVQGVITDSRETNVSINESPVMANSYRFVTPDGTVVEDFSYAVGRWHADGTTVTIEYPADTPQFSRIKGMRRQLFGPLGLLFALPLVIAIIFFYYRIRKGLRSKRLLETGHLTTATLLQKTKTNVAVNDQPVHKLTFAFFTADGTRHELTHKSHDTSMLEDEEAEGVLYDPASPDRAVFIDALPGQPEVDESGNVKPQSLPIASCIIPALVVLGHSAYAVFSFF